MIRDITAPPPQLLHNQFLQIHMTSLDGPFVSSTSFGAKPFKTWDEVLVVVRLHVHPCSSCWRGKTYRSRTWREVQNAGGSTVPDSLEEDDAPLPSVDFLSKALSSSENSDPPRLSEVVLPWSDHPRGCVCCCFARSGFLQPFCCWDAGATRARLTDLVCAASIKAHRAEASSSACPGVELATALAAAANTAAGRVDEARGGEGGRGGSLETAVEAVEVAPTR